MMETVLNVNDNRVCTSGRFTTVPLGVSGLSKHGRLEQGQMSHWWRVFQPPVPRVLLFPNSQSTTVCICNISKAWCVAISCHTSTIMTSAIFTICWWRPSFFFAKTLTLCGYPATTPAARLVHIWFCDTVQNKTKQEKQNNGKSYNARNLADTPMGTHNSLWRQYIGCFFL